MKVATQKKCKLIRGLSSSFKPDLLLNLTTLTNIFFILLESTKFYLSDFLAILHSTFVTPSDLTNLLMGLTGDKISDNIDGLGY